MLIDRLEKKLGKFTFPYLLITLLSGQVLFYFAKTSGSISQGLLVLNSHSVLSGDYWRVFSFMLDPLRAGPLFFALFVYITYLIGSKLEYEWGEFKFSLYLGMGWAFTVLFSFLTPAGIYTNFFIFLSLSMAFARIFPDFTFMVFFVLPVKAKYFGMLAGANFVLVILSAPVPQKLEAFAALLPFLLFFGKDFGTMMSQKKKAAAFRKKSRIPAGVPFHTCSICKRTDLSNPDLGFRYQGDVCICEICLEKRRNS